MPSYKKYIWVLFLQCQSIYRQIKIVLEKMFYTIITFEWVFFSVSLYMRGKMFFEKIPQKLYLNDFYPVWVFIWVDKVDFEKMPCHKNYIWMGFLQYESLYDQTKIVSEKISWYKNYIWIVFSSVSLYMVREWLF